MMRFQDLLTEIIAREKARLAIRAATDEYCRDRYGIEGFSAIADRFFAGQTSFAVCLGRQIATASIEHLAQERFAAWLTSQGLRAEPISLALAHDSFSGRSSLKISYVKVPFLGRGRKGLFCENGRIVPKKDMGELDGRILAKVITKAGESLPEYHYGLRAGVLGQAGLVIDASSLFVFFLEKSIEAGRGTPSYVYIDQGDYEGKMKIFSLDGEPLVRPPAEWYYFFALLMYVDGRRAMLSTVGDDEGLASWIEGAKVRVKEITGFTPLILDIPDRVKVGGYTSRHYAAEIPRWTLGNPNWRRRITMPSSSDLTLFEVYKHLEKQFIELA